MKRLIPPLFIILWASGFIGARYAMPWTEPFTFLSARLIIAAAIFALLIVILGAPKIPASMAIHAIIVGALIHGVYLGGMFWAIHQGMPAGLTALLAGLQPLIIAVMAGQLLGEKILRRHWLGLAIGLTGVTIVLWPTLGISGSGINMATLGAAICAVFAMSIGTIWQKRHGVSGNLLTGTFWQYIGAAAVTVPCALLFETRTIIINGELVFALVWLVLVLSVGAVFLLMILIRDGEMSKVGSLFYLVPAATALMAWALFRENLTLMQMAGMAITTAGVGLATIRAPSFRREPAPLLPGNG
ncbi:DMT family transporter [Aquamicrobium segne]|uniref:DMT family transporter n=1 Tax=Aquamicrobium segne TaxID=469547 RepID=A0ABW0H1K5_9HYPH